jgi:hypothetical protein
MTYLIIIVTMRMLTGELKNRYNYKDVHEEV